MEVSPLLAPSLWPQVLQVGMAPATPRPVVRERVRAALCTWLSAQLGRPVSEHDLAQNSAAPLRWNPTDRALAVHPFYFSIAHAEGLSLVAIHRGAPVGVDLMHVREIPEAGAEMARLLSEYAGPQVHAEFLLTDTGAPQNRPLHFARAWTLLEAKTKCKGMALAEWSMDSNRVPHPSPLQHRPLELPPGYCGSVVWAG